LNTLYLDIFSGISGDMFIGALIDLGVDFHRLEQDLAKLELDGYRLEVARRQKSGIEGVKFDVHLPDDQMEDAGHGHRHSEKEGRHSHDHGPGGDHHHHHGEGEQEGQEHTHVHGRNFADIRKLITDSKLSPWVKETAVAVFHRVAVAEGKIHGHPPAEVHFHEVGAVDSIVDIVGACIALELLGKPRVLAAGVTEGTGWVKCAHGRFPVPTPATLEILAARGVSVSQCDEPHELVTPTGAALLAELVEAFGPMTGMIAQKIGYGLGTRDNQTRPNVLRAVLGESASPASPSIATKVDESKNDWETDTIAVLEANLDDISAEILGHFVQVALTAGALDVFHTPIQMKKNRPGVLLTVLCPEGDADRFSELMLRETSTFGVRRHPAARRKLKREFATVRIPEGEISVKLGKLNGKVIHATPEYESCRKLAAQTGVPLARIYESAARALPSNADG
jgi:uncharacterized protein (TIGR00299 family) protein